jgi:hypothetical protein
MNYINQDYPKSEVNLAASALGLKPGLAMHNEYVRGYKNVKIASVIGVRWRSGSHPMNLYFFIRFKG